MKIIIDNSKDLYSGPFGFIAQVVVMALATVLAAYLLPGVRVDSIGTAILTAAVIALLNSFIRPILIVLTLPFTILTMGLFLLIIHAFTQVPRKRILGCFSFQPFAHRLELSARNTQPPYAPPQIPAL